MQLIKNGSIFTLPEGLTSIETGGIDFRTNQESRAGTHGAAETGDGKVDKRTLSIDVHIFGNSIADHDCQYDALMAALSRQDQRLYIRPDRYINLARLDKVTRKDLKGYQFVRSQITAAFVANDPFWYAEQPIEQARPISSTPTTVTINNQGNIDAPLIVTIAASADCSAVTLTNNTDAGRAFSMADVQLISGETAIINTALGTVYRGTSNTINTFSGAFLSLLPGVNSITYTGGNCTLTLGYTPRWL